MLYTFEVSYDDFALPVELIAIVGFIDNYQTMHILKRLILKNFQIIAEDYINDDYFIEKAII